MLHIIDKDQYSGIKNVLQKPGFQKPSVYHIPCECMCGLVCICGLVRLAEISYILKNIKLTARKPS